MLATCHKTHDGRIYLKEATYLSKKHEVSIIALKDDDVLGAINYPTRFIKLFIHGLRTDVDVYHCHEPGSLIIGYILSRIKNTKLVYDVHENWPSLTSIASVLFKPLKPFVEPYVMLIENLIVPKCDYVISVSESVQCRLLSYNSNHEIIYNYPIINNNIIVGTTKIEYSCCYTGNVGTKRGSDILERIASMDEHVTFNIIGSSYIEGYNNIVTTEWLPYDEMCTQMQKSKIGLILLQPTHLNNYIGLPQKLFEYMMLGIPIIAPDYPEIRRIVNTAKCGLLVDVTNADMVYEAIKYLLNNNKLRMEMGYNGRKYIKDKYNWKSEATKLLNVYEELKK